MKPSSFLFSWGLPSLFVGVLVFLGILFSHHGLLDLRRFEHELEAVRERASVVEEENRKLTRQLDLLEESSAQILERKAREVFGWVREGETIYLEPSKRKL